MSMPVMPPEVADQLGYLRDRWADESEYEDWDEYTRIIRELLREKMGLELIECPTSFRLVAKRGGEVYSIRVTADSVTMMARP